MTSVMGLDISSYALHACLLIDDQPPVLRMEHLGKPSEPLIERVRRVAHAVEQITQTGKSKVNSGTGVSYCVRPDWIIIEDAYGAHRKSDRALHFVTGAIIASAPAASQVALLRCADWRAALGAKNTKADGHRAAWEALLEHDSAAGCYDESPIETLDEHQLDCVGIALAWARILAANGQEAAR